MPTPSPGLKRVPRWRTMISPPVTVWPENTFTPRRLALESRPLRLEPRPFLCAMGSVLLPLDAGDADPGQLLTVTRPALVPALGLELEDAELRAALVGDDLGAHGGRAEAVAVEQRVAVAGQQQRLQFDGGAHLVGQALDEQGLALAHAVLLAAGLDHCVGHAHSLASETSAAPPSPSAAFARERRRPPLRPRRRGRDCSESPSPSSSASAPSASSSPSASCGSRSEEHTS